MTVRQFAPKLRDPILVEVVLNMLHFDGEDAPMLTLLVPLAQAHLRMTGIPKYGWL